MDSALRGARAINVSGQQPRSGSTTLSLAFARWLHEQGVHVAPLHLGDPGSWRWVPCPSAGKISWPAALLAEACGIPPEPAFEAGESALQGLQTRFDAIVIDRGAGSTGMSISRSGGRLRFELEGSPVSLREIDPLEALQPEPEDLQALPEWNSPASPRCGILSLPHLQHFGDWASIRGAEWLTAPGIGTYDFLFLPMTSDRGFDRDWIQQRGLANWLADQARQGAQVVSVGWNWEAARRVEPEVIGDDRELSRLTGVRWPRRLPTDAEWEALTRWLERGAGRERLLRLLP